MILKLNHIIIACLPKEELACLKKNLQGHKEAVFLHEEGEDMENRLNHFSAECSLLVAGDKRLLCRAKELGMATVAYASAMCETEEASLSPTLYAEGFAEIDFCFLERVYQRHHKLPWTIVTTERCIIREFTMTDLDALFALYEGEGMTDYMEPLLPYEEERTYQQAYIDYMYRFYGYGMWVVCKKETGELIGRVGVEYRTEGNGEPELGYAIGAAYQGKGFATETCLAILDYVKKELGMPQIYCLIEEGNQASEQVARRLGFSFIRKCEIGGKQMKKYVLRFP
ncbi:MAG: GNAT family N-acetyltransferase [Roseburia sp.]